MLIMSRRLSKLLSPSTPRTGATVVGVDVRVLAELDTQALRKTRWLVEVDDTAQQAHPPRCTMSAPGPSYLFDRLEPGG